MSSWRLTTSGLRARPTWDRYVTGAGYFDVYSVRMARVNITVPDELYDEARSAGLNVSRVAQDAIRAELARLGKVAELDAYLAELEAELGPHRRQASGPRRGRGRTGFSARPRTAAQHDRSCSTPMGSPCSPRAGHGWRSSGAEASGRAVVPAVVLAESLTGDHRRDYHENRVLRTCDRQAGRRGLWPGRPPSFASQVVRAGAAPLPWTRSWWRWPTLVGGATVLSSDLADLRALARHTVHRVDVAPA